MPWHTATGVNGGVINFQPVSQAHHQHHHQQHHQHQQQQHQQHPERALPARERAAHDSHWGYSGDGPSKWNEQFKAGKRQSPIDIAFHQCQLQLKLTCCAGEPAAEKAAGKQASWLTAGEAARSRSSSGVGSARDSPATLDGGVPAALDQSAGSLAGGRAELEQSGAGPEPAAWALGSLVRALPRAPSPLEAACGERPRELRHCVTRRKLFLGYPRYLDEVEVRNTGHGWQVDVGRELGAHTLLAGPPFGEREYRLAQFHCHWGADDRHGSEHTINGRAYAAELHFVHWNCSQFATFEEAAKQRHGLAVLGVLVEAVEADEARNKQLARLAAGLERVRDQPDSAARVKARLDLKKLFPDNRWLYATYEGSLTTPPLSEVVDWLVFLEPIRCSSAQIDQFRQLTAHDHQGAPARLVANCRPVQPLHERQITLWTHH